MPVLASNIDRKSVKYQENAKSMRHLVDALQMHTATVSQGGGEEACTRHVARGKLLPRVRVHQLLDPVSPFLELSQLAANGM